MDILEIRSDVDSILNEVALFEENNFEARADALDYVEFHIIDRIEGLLQKANPPKKLLLLKERAEELIRRLEKININLFQRLRIKIQTGDCMGAAFKDMVDKYVSRNLYSKQLEKMGYDNLDVFINGLLSTQPVPTETKKREPEMVFYQKTPARIIFDIVEKAYIREKDIFYDLGAGLGQVSILVNLLSRATSKGIEFEPTFCQYANICAVDLNLPRVEFINQDASIADYSGGTVFFMYTPFEGSMLQNVLETLRKESQRRKIRLITYGPCTPQVAKQSWLSHVYGDEDMDVFRSL